MAKMIDYKVEGLQQVRRKIDAIHSDIQKPDLTFGVRAMARVWDQSFRAEGSAVGGWQELSQYTQKKRAERGYNPEHPILQQTGRLYATTIKTLVNARGARTARADGIAMTSIYHGLTATLNASGAKADNQTGGKSDVKDRRGRSGRPVPARPFWFVNADVSSAAAAGIDRWVARMLREYR